MAESQYSKLCLLGIAEQPIGYDLMTDRERTKARNQFTALALLEGASKKRYGLLLSDLENDFLKGNTNIFSDSMEDAL